MATQILTLLGGLGLFLFGMQTMTDALRDLSSTQARRVLARFTNTPLSGVITGTLTTAVIQSSGATTVTVIGFVGAGLMSFSQAVGVIFGANLGTTVTGWMVATLGFKLQLGQIVLPILLAGSLLRILGRGRWRLVGFGLAGFAMLFLGIDLMKTGAAAFEGYLTPEILPGDSLGGRFLLVLLGAVVAAVLHSSSAGMATALVLLGSGTIEFTQAAAMAIGMDVGTTMTGMMATLGGSRAMRRTGVAHLTYNLLTATAGFALLGWLGPLALSLMDGDVQFGLVAFHTGFNLLGVVAMLPFAHRFASAIEWLIPDDGPAIGEAPDPGLLSDPAAAMDAAAGQAMRIARVLFAALAEALPPGGPRTPMTATARFTAPALDDLQNYVRRISLPESRAAVEARYGALIHQIDHLHRLNHRCQQPERITALRADADLRRAAQAVAAALVRQVEGTETDTARLDRLSALIARRELRLRASVGHGRNGADFERTDAVRWLRRVCLHSTRIAHYGALARETETQARRAAPVSVTPG
ncbi:phosphate:Na+ symporter [Rhodobacteraceae bacterium MBR-64]